MEYETVMCFTVFCLSRPISRAGAGSVNDLTVVRGFLRQRSGGRIRGPRLRVGYDFLLHLDALLSADTFDELGGRADGGDHPGGKRLVITIALHFRVGGRG